MYTMERSSSHYLNQRTHLAVLILGQLILLIIMFKIILYITHSVSSAIVSIYHQFISTKTASPAFI